MGEDIEYLKDIIEILRAEPKGNPNAFMELSANSQRELAQAIEKLIEEYIRVAHYANTAELNNSRFKNKIIEKINSRKFYLHQSNIDFESDDILKVLQSLLE